MDKIEYFTANEEDAYARCCFDPILNIKSIQIHNVDLVSVSHTTLEEFDEGVPNTNVVNAAYVTTQARLKLYEYLEILGERVCYCDTGNIIIIYHVSSILYIFTIYEYILDSVIYVSRPGDKDIPLGNKLGDMTSELKDFESGSYISQFIAAGPKSYCYNVHQPSSEQVVRVVKNKGQPFTYHTSHLINYESVCKLVKEYVQKKQTKEIEVTMPKIGIKMKPEAGIVTKTISKKFKVVFDKRIVKSDFSTLPFGY